MIRAARPYDAEAIAGLWNRMIRDTLATFTTVEKRADDIAGQIETRPGQWWVAAEDDIFGFAAFGPFRDGPGYAATCEHTVIVSRSARGRGVGKALIEQLERAARDSGYHVIVAAISGTNSDAIAFHARLGFEQVARMPEVGRKWEQWLDLVLMQKILTPEE
ncbi:MAG: N-acetyltransferase family protein [Pseudomonadota bacterium]